jgi:hypothetical protein
MFTNVLEGNPSSISESRNAREAGTLNLQEEFAKIDREWEEEQRRRSSLEEEESELGHD